MRSPRLLQLCLLGVLALVLAFSSDPLGKQDSSGDESTTAKIELASADSSMVTLATLSMASIELDDENSASPDIAQWRTKESWAEILYAAKHPREANTVRKGRKWAEALTKKYYSLEPWMKGQQIIDQNDRANAFRHMLWQGYITVNLGESAANRWGNVHEFGTDTPQTPKGNDQKADVINNGKGRVIGRYARYKHGASLAALDYVLANSRAYIRNGWYARQSTGK